MRRLLLPFAAFLVLPLLGSDSPKESEDATTLVSIEGEWRTIRVQPRGERAILVEKGKVWTFHDGRLTIEGQEGQVKTYKADPHFAPARLNLALADPPNRDIPWCSCSYRCDGDTLMIAVGPSRKRPTNFDETEHVVTFQRVKK